MMNGCGMRRRALAALVCVMAGGGWAALSGCEMPAGHQRFDWRAQTSKAKTDEVELAEAAAPRSEAAGDDLTPVVQYGRAPAAGNGVRQARDEVLAFIDRLDTNDPPVRSSQDAMMEDPFGLSPRRKRYTVDAPPRDLQRHRAADRQPGREQTATAAATDAPTQSAAPRVDGRAARRHEGPRLQGDDAGGGSSAARTTQPNRANAQRGEPNASPHVASPPRVLRVSTRPLDAASTAEWTGIHQREGAVETAAAPLTAPNMPMAADAVGTLDALIERMEADTEGRDLRGSWRLALLKLASGETADAVDFSDDLGAAEAGHLLSASVRAVDAIKSLSEDRAVDAGAALEAVDELRRRVRDRAPLSVPNVALCSRVKAFGVYEELAEGAFQPYAANQAIVYFEVANFSSEPTAEDRHRTLLRDRIEVMTREGVIMWHQEEPKIEDVSRRLREDFFVAQRVVLPPTLGEGEYVLKVTVEDLVGEKRTETVHNFRIGGMHADAGQR